MTDEIPSTRGSLAVFFIGGVFILVGSVWLVVLLSGTGGGSSNAVTSQRAPTPATTSAPAPTESAAPAPVVSAGPVPTRTPPAEGLSLSNFAAQLLLDNDLGTGSQEFSAVTLNESMNRLMVADDEGFVFEFGLTSEGEPIVPARRVLRVEVGAGDIEGLAWMTGSTYVLAHENDGRLMIVEIDDDTVAIGEEHVRRIVATGIQEENGNGLEGVAYVSGGGDVEFVVVDERPPTLHLVTPDGTIERVVPLPLDLPDASDLWVAPDGTYWVLSDEGRVIVQLALDDSGVVSQIGSLDLQLGDGRFEQPEGVVSSRDGTRLYVVGEAPGPGRFSFGVWTHN